jgi:hypothetical protein
MDAAQIEGHHLWREFLGAVSDQFSMGRFALPAHDFISELASDGCPATDAVAQRTSFETAEAVQSKGERCCSMSAPK